MNITAELSPLYAVPKENAKQYIKWAWHSRDRSSLDASVLSYPRACMATAYQDGKPILFVPLHPVLMMESLADDPELNNRQRALGLWRVAEQLDKAMKDTGIRETYFLTKDREYANKVCKHGFEEVKGFIVLKRKG